jgi:hypothetical protein
MSRIQFAAGFLALMTCAGYAAEPAQLSPDQTKVLESARAYAMKYTHELPDFICTQITHRSAMKNMDASSGAGISGRSPIAAMANGMGYKSDVIEEQLTYVGGKENYSALTLNGKKMAGVDPMKLNGANSKGEFGSLLVELFDPASHTTFTWGHETRVHGRRAWVYDFEVPREAGTYAVAGDSEKAVLVPLSGEVSIVPESGEVLQISSKLDLPLDFPIRIARRSVEYAPQQIAGKSYLLPSRSLVHMEDSKQIYDNKIDFKNYHRFASESTIHFNSDDKQK